MFTVIHKHYSVKEWQKFSSEVSSDMFKVILVGGAGAAARDYGIN